MTVGRRVQGCETCPLVDRWDFLEHATIAVASVDVDKMYRSDKNAGEWEAAVVTL